LIELDGTFKDTNDST